MKKIFNISILFILLLITFGSIKLSAQDITVTVCLKASDGVTGIEGAKVEYAPGGTWYTFGTTGIDGCVSMDLPDATTNVKIRIAYNQGSQTVTQNIQTNPNFNFQTVKAFIKLQDHNGDGIEGGKLEQGGGFWQNHGYTDVDGMFELEMFPGSYKFRMGLNGSSQIITQDISSPVIFQTGEVKRDNDYTGNVRASIGGSWQYLWPSPGSSAELLPGTFNFVYSSPIPSGGSPESVTVVAGQTNIIPWGGIYVPTPCELTAEVTASQLTVYYGYLPESSSTLTATPSDGAEPYNYLWSTGGTDQSITVSPTTNTSYSVTVTDANGCTVTNDDIDITVEDVTCGKQGDKVQIWHVTGNGKYVQICVSSNAIPAHLAHGDVWTLNKQNFSDSNKAPAEFELNPNYPNPFNPTTTIRYGLPENSYVTLKVYSLLGEEVATLVNEHQKAGIYEVKFSAGDLASGIYIYRIHTDKFTATKKLMLMK